MAIVRLRMLENSSVEVLQTSYHYTISLLFIEREFFHASAWFSTKDAAIVMNQVINILVILKAVTSFALAHTEASKRQHDVMNTR